MAKKHFNISEIVVKGRDSDYEKRFAEHMKQVIVSGSKTYNLTSKEILICIIVQRLWKRKSFDSSFFFK